MQLRKIIFLQPEKYLLGEDPMTYEFLKFIGQELPEYFDEEDLASVMFDFIIELGHFPEKLPDWMQHNLLFVAKQCSKVRELLLVSGHPSMERFVMVYDRLLERHRNIEA